MCVEYTSLNCYYQLRDRNESHYQDLEPEPEPSAPLEQDLYKVFGAEENYSSKYYSYKVKIIA